MKAFLSFVFSLSLCLLCSSIDTNLKLVQIMFRHGDRTPIDTSTYPNDLYNETTFEKYGGYGQLTQKGMKQHYELGQYLRTLYRNFLNKHYTHSEVYAQSTDYDRTLMSAYSLLAGLYPPEDYQRFKADLTWQPIPVHTIPLNNTLMPQWCPKYDILRKQVYDTAELSDIEKENKDLFTLVSEKSGFNKNLTIDDVARISDTLFCQKQAGLQLPDWVTDDVFNKMRKISDAAMYFTFYTTEMAKLNSGGFLNDMVNNIKLKTNGSLNQLYLYSLHDTNIAAMNKLLDSQTRVSQPPYASAVILELRQSIQTSDWYVQVMLKNKTAEEPISLQPITIQGCDQLCPLGKFNAVIKELAVSNFSTACAA